VVDRESGLHEFGGRVPTSGVAHETVVPEGTVGCEQDPEGGEVGPGVRFEIDASVDGGKRDQKRDCRKETGIDFLGGS
jgi:hypothetical protein